MIKNFIKTAWRNATKSKVHSAISMVSLVSGLTFFCLIMLWVKDEMSYDRGDKANEGICRVETSLITKAGTPPSLSSAVGWPVGRALLAEYPEVQSLTYMSFWSPVITFKGHKFYEDALFADKNFFKVFGNTLAEGDPDTALSEPHCVVIIQALKQKYFGNADALGKVLMLSDTVPFKITGVLKEQTT